MDETDPLWIAVLQIAKGDKDKAKAMIADPDSLMQYPEVVQLLLSQDATQGASEEEEEDEQEDWEADKDTHHLTQQMDSKLKLQDTTPTFESPSTSIPMELEEEITDATTLDANIFEGDPREHVNLVFIGHIDAGKSTLSGNILYITDNVDKRTIEKYEREAKDRGRDSWFLAYIMDTDDSERAKGITVEVGKAHFETEKKRYTMMDAPGHKNYVPNMIMGASQADVAVLVISARKGEFEAGFDRHGQTREHAMLAKTLGVSYLVVVINKMDEPTVQWDKARFDECVTKLRPFLKNCGFVIKNEVRFLPISGLGGANVRDEVDPKVCPWWRKCYESGENNTFQPTLFSLLDSMEIKGRKPDAPVRIPVLERYSDRGTICMGKVESGTIYPGLKVIVMPTRQQFKIDSVWSGEDTLVKKAEPGENVLIKLSGATTDDVFKGCVICTNPPCRAVDKIIAQVGLMDMPENQKIFTAGFQSIFHAHTLAEECNVVKLFETTNARGQVNKEPRFASIGMKCICMIQLNRTISCEVFDEFPFLGRFTLRTEGKTIAIGKIIKLPPKKE
jgi:peptide chain release factor subunit 3